MDRSGAYCGGGAVKMGLALAIWLLGCSGGEKSPTEPIVTEPVVATNGTVSVANRTAYVLEVAYLNEVDAEDPRIVRTQVPAGGRAVVSGEVLPGGLEIEFDLVLIPPTGNGVRVRRKMRVVIDGDQVLAVHLKDEADPFSVEIELDDAQAALSSGTRATRSRMIVQSTGARAT